ncbi:hypothetical protein [Ensifer aridi]|nr:hypothetical protein [Ensifer aridi]
MAKLTVVIAHYGTVLKSVDIWTPDDPINASRNACQMLKGGRRLKH